MKAIGTFVVILLAGIGIVVYVVTRPPDRELDAEGRAWVAEYQAWNARTERQIDRALIGMEFEAEAKNDRLIEPLRQCFAALTGFGQPPEFLSDVQRLTLNACGRAERAVAVNDRFGDASLATIKLNLSEAEDSLLTARRTLRIQLGQVE